MNYSIIYFSRISRQAAARIPLVKLRSSMRRARLENRPLIPRSLKDFHKVLRQKKYRALSRTLDGKDNIYAGRAGSASEKTISLVFVTRRMRKYMRKVKKLFCDATFSPVPRGLRASQVWTLSSIRRHHVSMFLAAHWNAGVCSVSLLCTRSNCLQSRSSHCIHWHLYR